MWDVLPEVQGLVRDADVLEPDARVRLLNEIVRWTVEAYFSPPSR